MWTRWKKSTRGCGNAAADSVVTTTTTVTVSAKKTPSLKDLQSLVLLQDQDQDEAAGPKKSSSNTIFHRVRIASTAVRAWKSFSAAGNANADSNRSIVLYYTSLRVVRRTFEDCRAVRSILGGFRVAIDERDLSMDSSFLSELQGKEKEEQLLSLPRLFVGGRYVGGADEVQMLHETGELKKIIEGGAPPLLVGPGAGGTCEGCGGFRFVLCGSCSGSHKYFHKEEGAFLTCTACNENGLLRCPQCYVTCSNS